MDATALPPITPLEVIPNPPYAQIKHLRKRKRNLGGKIAAKLDPEDDILTPEQHRQLLSVDNDEELSELLCADLGDALAPDLKLAEDAIAKLRKANRMPDVIMTMRFFTVAQYMITIDDARVRSRDSKSTRLERAEALKLCHQATMEMHVLVNQLQRMAKPKVKEVAPVEEPEKKPAPLISTVAPDLD